MSVTTAAFSFLFNFPTFQSLQVSWSQEVFLRLSFHPTKVPKCWMA